MRTSGGASAAAGGAAPYSRGESNLKADDRQADVTFGGNRVVVRCSSDEQECNWDAQLERRDRSVM
jgi:hypothetical protein